VLRDYAAHGEMFAIALVDMKMPRMNGLELVRAMKAEPDFAQLPVVMLTSLGSEGQVASARQAGIVACLSKPVRKDELRKVISAALNPHARRDLAECAGPAARIMLAGHVLLAEDNPVNQAVALGMLDALGLTADVAGNGNEVIERLVAERYDVVLMDCQMPDLDGFAATAEIRRREQGSAGHLPIVALTANALDGDRETCVAAGMDDYLAKPFSREQLALALSRWLPRAASPRENPDFSPSASAPDDTGLAGPVNARTLEAIRNLPGTDGTALVNKVIHAYFEDTPVRLAQMKSAIEAGDAEALRKAAHGMKSSSANVGAERLAGLCRDLEMIGRDGALDAAPLLLHRTAGELAIVLDALQPQIREPVEHAHD
jgi:CheY-like chemotaxis protein/HPt (histidine-containing phosphotransfer) domain-containing protein